MLLLVMSVAVGPAGAQNQTPVDSGPLPGTMKFIQDTLNNQATVAFDVHSQYGTSHISYRISGATADMTSCTLRKSTAYEERYAGGQALRDARTTMMPLKDIENILVEGGQDIFNRQGQSAATHTPEYYAVTLAASKPVFKAQYTATTVRDGQEFPATSEVADKNDSTLFADQDTADRVAKALTVAVKLCGGGQKGPSQ
ncbi:MAG TPA: hypothetical protein VK828_09790 [Terriglobales bacterium]|nr:hypothetical protein [Terriglobales bacterium]